MNASLSLGILLSSVVTAIIACCFSFGMALGILIGSTTLYIDLFLLNKLFEKSLAEMRLNRIRFFYVTAAKALIVTIGLILTALIGYMAVIGLFIGVTAGVIGAAIAGLTEKKNASSH